jgi:hypothetical protein
MNNEEEAPRLSRSATWKSKDWQIEKLSRIDVTVEVTSVWIKWQIRKFIFQSYQILLEWEKARNIYRANFVTRMEDMENSLKFETDNVSGLRHL